MSILLGDIERARASHDAQRHLDEDALLADPDVDEDLPDASHPDTSAAAYVLDWHAGEGIPRRTDVTTPEQLVVVLQRPHAPECRRLVVLRGLPPGYATVLEAAGGIDMAFVEAHMQRRAYRPQGVWRRREARFESWEYPELVFGVDAASGGTGTAERRDGMVIPEVRHVAKKDGKEGLGAVFCRASLWVGTAAAVLLLDRRIWAEPEASVRKHQSGGDTTTPASEHGSGDVLPSLDGILLQILSHERQFPQGSWLEETVFDLWLELFEQLKPPTTHRRSGTSMTATLLWKMLHSLERNEDVAAYRVRRSPVENREQAPRYTSWGTLLERVQRRATLMSASPAGVRATLTPTSTMLSARVARTTGSSNRATSAGSPGAAGTLPPGRTPGRSGRELLDENHRALDRISYLGGILLPLPIVSSILSMTDEYGPGGSMFYVFWAVSLPLSVLAVMIIYADTIRRAEVWVEVAAEHVAALPTTGGAEEVSEDKGQGSSFWQRVRQRLGLEEDKADEEAQMPPAVEPKTSSAPAAAAPAEKGEELAASDTEGEVEVPLPMLLSLGPGLFGMEQAEEEDAPEVILETPSAGRRARAWKRKKLGWVGAMRAILSREKPRYCYDHPPEGVAAYERERKR